MLKIKRTYKHPHGLNKFFILLLILAIYAAYVIFKFGLKDGLSTTFLTWAFFVTCTPIADAGFLVDFPVRILLGIKMIISEIIVWILALAVVAYHFIFNVEAFDTVEILRVFHTIIVNPWPLWTIVIVSLIGTFISIHLGDKIFTMVQQRNHHKHIKKLQLRRLVLEVTIFALVLALYFTLLSLTGISV